ncbi:MAG: SRPBCC family protein [Acidimicrobiales bacterium]
MPTYTAVIDSPLTPEAVWQRVSDVTTFAHWDPGTRSAVQVEGDGPGLGAGYVLTVGSLGGPLELRYEVTEFEPPRRLHLVADTGTLRSDDRITVEPAGAGSRVTYRAYLGLHGPWVVFTPLLALAFRRIAGKGAAGLGTYLDGSSS